MVLFRWQGRDTRRQHAVHSCGRGFRPALEQLEDRRLPTLTALFPLAHGLWELPAGFRWPTGAETTTRSVAQDARSSEETPGTPVLANLAAATFAAPEGASSSHLPGRNEESLTGTPGTSSARYEIADPMTIPCESICQANPLPYPPNLVMCVIATGTQTCVSEPVD